MQDNNFELSVSTDVLEKMAEIATTETEGVASITKKAIDIKGAFKNMNAFKGVKVENVNDSIAINIYVTLKSNAKMRETVAAIQQNVKDKIQTMTNTAVTKVNVTVADVDFSGDEEN